MEDLETMKKIVSLYYADRGVTDVRKFNGVKSRPDGIMISGGSDILYEQKNRPISVLTYRSVMLEKQKHDSMVQAIELLNTPPFYLYVVEYLECILIYRIPFNAEFFYELMPCPEHNGSTTETVLKPVTMLPFADVNVMISKRNDNWTVRTVDEFVNHWKVKRLEFYGNEE